ncbi:glycosyl transferase, WecB/TagA/CpsF family [Gloeothece citriformis PCC 7424]|uniref:Glycosyl transferase, WecB/TagA/CpsF family n=1 Tax=Gloeothece citriformis (strain PCC 7424) TaxID=65393 RepID=B7KAN5_GLOC7|nr:WecB/TagA/CpsF family glycosyltransferase [Gloeothece citriformis]ACK68707.1 glycosyl transferase, WecB/TagA/CpsF family [Gloeothece citriformis PCC 7424]
MKNINLLNISIHNITQHELLQRLTQYGGIVITSNVDHLIKLQKDPEFLEAYHGATYRTCDSKIVQYASQFLGTPIIEKISGSDLFPAFYQYNKSNTDIKIFLLGAGEGVARKAQEKINQKVNREIVIDVYSPSFGFEQNELECQQIIERINQSGATVLAIGVGSPKQEKWIMKYKHQMPHIKIFLGIGATIDFEAGHKPRSPKWMSEVGLEWLYRLLSEPKRLWKRYLVEDIYFFWLILQQKLRRYQSPSFQVRSSLEPSKN